MVKRNIMERRFIDVFTAYDGSKVRLPLMIKRSAKSGPKVFLVGVVHGEEVIGIEVIHRVFESIKLERGALFAIPVANMGGFSLGVRTVPYGESADWTNLNHIFPGKQNGSPAERIAAAIYEAITAEKPDLVIDIHADSHNSIPFILLDRLVKGKDAKLVKDTENFAEIFGVTFCNDDSPEDYLADDTEKTLSGALFNWARLPAFTVELGGPMVVKESFARIGAAGVKNVLSHLGMISAWRTVKAKSKISAGHSLRTLTVVAPNNSGKIGYKVKAGKEVKKGETIAFLEDVFGRKQEEIKSPEDGYVISLGYQALAFPGMTIATLAIKDQTP